MGIIILLSFSIKILLVTLSIYDKIDLRVSEQLIVLKFLNESEFWTNQLSEWIKDHLFGIQIEFAVPK